MKKYYLPLLLLFLSFSTFVTAQSHSSHTNLPIDSRLYDVFDGDFLNDLKTGNPFLLQRWNFYLDNAWYITPLPVEKAKADYPFVRIEDLNNFNILLLEKEQHLERDWDSQRVYKIENSNKALVFYSGKEFTRMLNEHLKR